MAGWPSSCVPPSSVSCLKRMLVWSSLRGEKRECVREGEKGVCGGSRRGVAYLMIG